MADEPEHLSLYQFRELRLDLNEQRSLLLAVAEQTRRTDRHVGELRDELEMTIKIELMGRLGNFETRIGELLHRFLDERVAPSTQGPPL